jgi:hypothetical protein
MRTRHFAWLGLAALGLAACSGTTLTDGSTTVLTGSQMTEIGLASSDELDASLSAFTMSDELVPIGFAPAVPMASSTVALASDMMPNCVTVNPNPPTDTDGDGIPDDATITFDCHRAVRGGTFDHTGDLRLQDTNPENGFDLTETLTNLTWSFTDNNHGAWSFTATRNGTRSRSGTADGATLNEDMTIVRSRPGKDDATIHRVVTVTFTPAEGSTLAMHAPLPSGTFTVEGSQSWERGTESFSFTVTTVTPLAYNAGCTLTHQRIEAGQLRFDATVNGHTGYLLLTWTSCGMPPSREWVETSAAS